jgi:hypothetical protein
MKLNLGFLPLLTLLFVALKLTGYIAWSWWLVFLPFYAPLTLILIVMGLGGYAVFSAWNQE